MARRALLLSLVLTALTTFGGASPSQADDTPHDGEDINVHNRTGHEVLVFLFQDSRPHLDESGGVQIAHLKNGESAVSHVPTCTFALLLVDHDDVWHAEYHDCKSTELTFNKDTGHAKKKR